MIRPRDRLGAACPVLLLVGCATTTQPDAAIVTLPAMPVAAVVTPRPAARPLPAFAPATAKAARHSPPAPAANAPLHLDYRYGGASGRIGLGGGLPVPRLGVFTRARLDFGAGVQGRDRRFAAVAGVRLKLGRESADRRWRAGFEFGSALGSRPAVRTHWTQRLDTGAFGTLTGGVLVANAAIPDLPFAPPSAASAFTDFWQPALRRAGASALALGRLAWQAHGRWTLPGGSRLRPGLAVDVRGGRTHAGLTLGFDTALGRWSLGLDDDDDGRLQAGLRYGSAL